MAALKPISAPDIRDAKRLVVKIGSALLVDRKLGLKTNWLQALALDVVAAKQRGSDVALVSSGSIALGRKVLNLGDGVLTLEQSQAAAAVGQIRLARAYDYAGDRTRARETMRTAVELETAKRRGG